MLGRMLLRPSGIAAPLLDLDFTAFTPGVYGAVAWAALTGGGLFTRASDNATVQTSAPTSGATPPLVDAGTDDARIFSDGTDVGLLIEPSQTNLLPDALDFRDSAGWSFNGGSTATAHAARITRFNAFSASGGTNLVSTAISALPVCSQFWARATSGTAASQHLMGAFPNDYTAVDLTTTWQLVRKFRDTMTGTRNFYFGEFFGGPRAGAGVGVDFLAAYAQQQTTRHFGSIIRRQNGVSGSDVLAGDRPKFLASSLVANGRLKVYISLKALAARGDCAVGTKAILHGANFDVTLDQATGVLTVTANGKPLACEISLDWAAGDVIQLILEFGGASIGTLVWAKVGSGLLKLLGTSGGDPQGVLTSSGTVDIMNNAANGQIPMLLQRLVAYA